MASGGDHPGIRHCPGGRHKGIDDYISRVIQQLTGGRVQLATGPIQRTRVNGIPASYVVGRANTSSGAVDVGVFAYQWDANTIYHFVTLTRGGKGHPSPRWWIRFAASHRRRHRQSVRR